MQGIVTNGKLLYSLFHVLMIFHCITMLMINNCYIEHFILLLVNLNKKKIKTLGIQFDLLLFIN